MLGLPVLTATAGFQPSMIMLVLCWLFMMVTGLLLLEVNLWYDDEVSIVSMAERTLGTPGKVVSWLVYLFLFYSLMVAFVAGSGAFFAEIVNDGFGFSIPRWVGNFGFAGLFAVIVYFGTGSVDWVNRLLMAGLIGAYFLMVGAGSGHVRAEYLAHHSWSAALFVIPAMVTSFGYHNLIPSLTYYLGKNRARLRTAVIVGSSIPLLVYVVWQWLLLGMVPLEGEGGLREALEQGEMATQALRRAVGAAWIVDIAEAFSFFAIVTSYLGVALSFVDFLADGLRVKKTPQSRVMLCGMVLAPPLVMALANPGIFLVALTYAGGFGAVVLFGILPALMVWRGREGIGQGQARLVPGGRVTLAIIVTISVMIVGLKLAEELNLFS